MPPGSGALETEDGICAYAPFSSRFATVSGKVLDDSQQNQIGYLDGARVTLYIETLSDPVVAAANRWGDFAFVNIPVRRRGITCDWVQVDAAGFGGLTIKGDSISSSDGFIQNLGLLSRKRSVEWAQGVMPDRCRDWIPVSLRDS
jgi:hypothetical protein